MSKPVKEMVRRALARRFEGLTSMAIVGFTGLDAVTTSKIRGRLREKEISLMVVKNSLVKQAFRSLGLDAAADLIGGPCAIAYGGDNLVSVVRELMEIGDESPQLTVKAALLDGEVFDGDAEVKALSRFPTRDEAIAQLAGCLVSVGASLTGCVIGPASRVAALVQAVEEKSAGQAG